MVVNTKLLLLQIYLDTSKANPMTHVFNGFQAFD